MWLKCVYYHRIVITVLHYRQTAACDVRFEACSSTLSPFNDNMSSVEYIDFTATSTHKLHKYYVARLQWKTNRCRYYSNNVLLLF